MVIIISILFDFFINILLIYPLYGMAFWSASSAKGMSQIIETQLIYQLINPIKFITTYVIVIPTYMSLKKVL